MHKKNLLLYDQSLLRSSQQPLSYPSGVRGSGAVSCIEPQTAYISIKTSENSYKFCSEMRFITIPKRTANVNGFTKQLISSMLRGSNLTVQNN